MAAGAVLFLGGFLAAVAMAVTFFMVMFVAMFMIVLMPMIVMMAMPMVMPMVMAVVMVAAAAIETLFAIAGCVTTRHVNLSVLSKINDWDVIIESGF